MNTSLLSVALPVYNGADYLREALDSILAQDFVDFELVVSDNCSTDDTPAILAEYAVRDARVRVSRSDVFLEQADNVNRAIELCTSDWVKLFCHDDIMLPNCLGVLRRVISRDITERVALIGDAPAWLFANGYKHYSCDGLGSPFVFHGRDLLRSLLSGRPHGFIPALTTATVRREAFLSSMRFDRRYKHFDVFLWMRLLIDWDYVFIPQVLTLTRIHDSQVHVTTQKSLRTIDDQRRFCREFLSEYAEALALGPREKLMAQLRPVAAAGTVIAIALIKHTCRRAFQIARKLPLPWWPLLPFFVTRAYLRERKKVESLKRYVPVHLIYPG